MQINGKTAFFALSAIVATPASAADISAIAAIRGTSDSNLYRQAPAITDTLGSKAADHVLTADATVMLETMRGTFDISAHATGEHSIFARNKDLENSAYNLALSVKNFGTVSSLDLEAASLRRLIPYQDAQITERAIQTLSTASILGTRAFFGDLRLVAGADFARSSNSSAAIAINDYQRYGLRIGVGYYSPAGNIAAIEGHSSDSRGLGQYTLLIGGQPLPYRNSYSERSIEAHLLYAPSALISFDGRLGTSRHRDKSGVTPGFSGITGQADARWKPRDTLTFDLHAQRSFQTDSSLLANGVRVTSVSVRADGQMTRSVKLSVDAVRSWRSFQVGLNQPTTTVLAHQERINTFDGSLTYTPSNRFTASLTATRAKRSSNLAIYNFSDTTVSASLEIHFGSLALQPFQSL